ncbi:MAG: hypothetical protein M4579_004600, partial [Chaenotheca gracillima]
MKVTTKGGGNCTVETTPGEKAGAGSRRPLIILRTGTHAGRMIPIRSQECSILRIPFDLFYADFVDQGFGDYSIEFVATDRTVGKNAPANGQSTCEAEGLCHPVVHFNHRDQGQTITQSLFSEVYDGTVSGDGFVRLCFGGVLDQVSSGGDVMGYT